ncbi:hypothetical protein LEP1GSC047_1235 [Leptospira inadai serovar Lyme str. 10]|uniref:Yip1 domain protein n=2 Tax=Leptospira inadai serovar Lyme TaxID=293084 RepID=V6HH26_9LEPT|nr:hypothetical protein [Leptospira inadai]EQA35315.1 hypothetical protein LEP1GSC047_1235 [Leptospira inadai serovar Lyme str. 10]PNV75976.1 hypothetical protein BES34_005570 [Leptospira inadai serovar Lyme]
MIPISQIESVSEVDKAKLSLLERLFRSPEEAFDLYLREPLLGRKELFRLHYALWILGPIAKFSSNLIRIAFEWIFAEEVSTSFFSGVLASIVVYPIILFVVFQLDVLRVFYRKIDRTKGESFPPADVLTIAFLPFSASSIFWILPSPFHALFIGIAFLYSYYLCFVGMRRVSGSEAGEFLIFSLTSVAYLLSLALVFTILYNIFRTLLN